MPQRFIILSVLPLLAVAPALSRAAAPPAAFPDDELRQAQELAQQAGGELLRSFERLWNAIPAYGAPYVDAHGNIVIPRRQPTPSPHLLAMPDPAMERT
jgi:hypothetical protein